jgi:hypothetical protein
MFNLPSEPQKERPVSKAHKPYLNAGPQITPRLESFLKVIGQQGVLRFDQAQQILGRLSPEPDKMKHSGVLSAERTRKFLRPWFNEELLNYRVFYVGQKGGLWLTSKGLKYANLNLRYYEPTPASLHHHYAVNDIRLMIEARRPQETWRSERELRAEQNACRKGSTPPHVPDAELISPNGNIRAIEAELTAKSEKRLEEIVFDLAGNTRYSTIWYFLPEHVFPVVKKAVGKLPSEHRKRFVYYSLEGELYEQ